MIVYIVDNLFIKHEYLQSVKENTLCLVKFSNRGEMRYLCVDNVYLLYDFSTNSFWFILLNAFNLFTNKRLFYYITADNSFNI